MTIGVLNVKAEKEQLAERGSSEAFPWGNGAGIAPILSNAELWIQLIDRADPTMRRSIKAVAKHLRIVKSGRVVRVEDNATIGELAVLLFSGEKRRGELLKEWRRKFKKLEPLRVLGRELLAHSLATTTSQTDPSTGTFGLDKSTDLAVGETFVPDSLHRSGILLVDAFRDWCTSQDFVPAALEQTALFASAYAMRQPEDARAILRILLEADTRFADLILPRDQDEAIEGSTPTSERPLASDHAAIRSDGEAGSTATEPTPEHSLERPAAEPSGKPAPHDAATESINHLAVLNSDPGDSWDKRPSETR